MSWADQTPSYQWDRSADGALGAPPDAPGWFCGMRLAVWPWRMLAGIVDYGLFFFIPWKLLSPYNQFFALLVCLSLSMLNSGLLAAWTMQSLGKRIFGLKIVQVRKGRDQEMYVTKMPIFVGLIRVPLHLIFDYAPCFIGFLAPIPNKSKATFADMMCRTLVYRDPRLPEPVQVRGVTQWP
jgi:hypothetical protein